MRLRRGQALFHFLFLPSVLGCYLTTSSLSAGWPAISPTDNLSAHRADRISVEELPGLPEATLAVPVQRQTPVESADGGGRQGHVLKAVPGMMMSRSTHDAGNSSLDPVGALVPSRMLQGTKKLDRDAATESSLITAPQH
jgi:hypothetical protein